MEQPLCQVSLDSISVLLTDQDRTIPIQNIKQRYKYSHCLRKSNKTHDYTQLYISPLVYQTPVRGLEVCPQPGHSQQHQVNFLHTTKLTQGDICNFQWPLHQMANSESVHGMGTFATGGMDY